MRRNLDGCVRAAGCRAADEQRHRKALTLHLGGNKTHLFQRGRNQARKADDTGRVFPRGGENFICRDHHAEVDHLEAVAGQHHGDDVFADVMNIALHRRQHDAALARAAAAQLFRFDERHQMRHGLFHHARRFHDLRQEHFARAEQIADRLHARHQRPFDDGQRRQAFGFQPGAQLFRVRDHEIRNAFHHRVFEPFFRRRGTPGRIRPGAARVFFPRFVRFDRLRKRHQCLARAGRAVEHYVFHFFAQRGVEIVIDAEHAGVDDSHRHSSANGMIEKYRVNRLAHRVVAAKAETDVRDAARGVRVRQIFPDPAHRLEKIHRVMVVRVNAGADGENIRVKNNVFGRKACAAFGFRFKQQIVGARADGFFARERVGLPGFIKRHDDDCRAVSTRQPGLPQEFRVARFERNRIHHAFALNALQPRLDHVPARRINHHRHLRDVRFGGDEFQKARHGGFRVQHRLIHIDVDDLRPVFHLLTRHGQRVVITPFADHPGERP